MKNILFVLMAALLSVGLTACGDEPKAEEKTAAKEKKEVSLTLDKNEITPDENGYFEVQGTTEKGAKVYIEGSEIDVDENGWFGVNNTYTGDGDKTLSIEAKKKGEKENLQIVTLHKPKEKIYGLNEEAIVKQGGENLFSITINKTSYDLSKDWYERADAYPDVNSNNLIEVVYTLKNYSAGENFDSLFTDFTVYDDAGSTLELVDYTGAGNGNGISNGKNTKYTLWYELTSKTSKIAIDYSHDGHNLSFVSSIN